MDHTGYQQKHQPSHWQRHDSFCLIFIQVSRGELAGPLSNSVQVKYLISSDDVHVLGFISHWVKFYHIQIEVIIKQQYFTQQPSGILCPIVVTAYFFGTLSGSEVQHRATSHSSTADHNWPHPAVMLGVMFKRFEPLTTSRFNDNAV